MMGSNGVRALFVAILFSLVLLPFLPESAHAQQPADPAARLDAADLSTQMTTTQFRHIKLWFAGKLGNWKLAAYELDQLASRLNEAASRTPVGAAADDTASQITSLRNAIDAKDLSAFTKAYSELTNACNDCHRAAGRGFVSVQVPAVSPFTDQDFADQVAEGRKLAYAVCGVCHIVPDKPNAPLAMSFSAPSFVDLARRPAFTEATLRQLLGSEHRRVGPAQAMPNPRLNDNQIDDVVAYFEALKAEQKKGP
jgi:mono/diheme cytochrome c family protein